MASKEKKGLERAKTERKPKDFSKVKGVVQSRAFEDILVAVASALVGAGATYFATSSNSETEALATMKGDTITVSDFYNTTKSTSSLQQIMLNLILSRVFKDQHGDKAPGDDASEAYNTTASPYGPSFSNIPSAAGLTSDTCKQQIHTPMLVGYVVKQVAKKKLTAKNYKAACEGYNPDTTTIVIALSDEDTADSVHDQATADGADLGTITKDNTTADKTEHTFDLADTDLPEDVMSAAFDQDKGSVSDVIKVLDTSTCSYTYYVVKATKKIEKGSDWKTYKKRLKKIILAQHESDINLQNEVIVKVLGKANVKIKDGSSVNILLRYATNLSSLSPSSPGSSSSSSSSSDDSSSSSSAEESFIIGSSDE